MLNWSKWPYNKQSMITFAQSLLWYSASEIFASHAVLEQIFIITKKERKKEVYMVKPLVQGKTQDLITKETKLSKHW